MLNYGDDWGYAGTRLEGSVVRFENYPVKVDMVDGKNSHIVKLGFHKGLVVPTNELDINPVPLGFVNTKVGVCYTSRIPTRRYKQGLRYESFYCETMVGHPITYDSPALVPTVLGNFPSIEECLNSIFNGEVVQIAFHRHWSLGRISSGRACKLFLKKLHAGHVILDGKNNIKVDLYENHNYLKETLEEVLNGVQH